MAVYILLKSLLRNTVAATAVEYGLILAMVVLAMLAAMQDFADATIAMWDDVDAKVATATAS